MESQLNQVAERRQRQFDALTHTHWDALVIGGGITGSGIAWQLARWGIKVALIEQGDYASGTSSRSSKLIHGGFRYLPHGELRLVRQVSRERTRLAQLMPHLIQPLPMTIPAYHGGPFSLSTLAFGSWVYDHLSHIDRDMSHRRLSASDVQTRTPGILPQQLTGGIAYYEFTGHDARINWAVVQTAEYLGTLTMNYVRANLAQSRLSADAPSFVTIEDRLSGRSGSVEARVVVNAGGPWADTLDPESHLVRSRGIHLVFPRDRFPLHYATILPTPENANIFAVPRGPITYLGTTDNPDDGMVDSPQLPVSDAQYLLDVANRMFPGAALKLTDVIAAWSGVRPLIAQDREQRTDRLSRRDLIVARPSMVTVLGGKFTGFRATAESVAETVLTRLGGTGRTPQPEAIVGAPGTLAMAGLRAQLTERAGNWADLLIQRYGSRSLEWWEWAKQQGTEAIEPIRETAPLLTAEIDWAILREQAVSLADVLIRRSGLAWLGGLAPHVLREVAQRTADRMRTRLEWSPEERERQLTQFFHAAYVDDVARFRETS